MCGASGRPSGPHESMYPTPSVLQFVSDKIYDFAIPRVDVGKEMSNINDIAFVFVVNVVCAKLSKHGLLQTLVFAIGLG